MERLEAAIPKSADYANFAKTLQANFKMATLGSQVEVFFRLVIAEKHR
jgi:hypothetical protein